MKLRSLIVLGALVGTLAPSGAQANHCGNPIYIFTYNRTTTDIDDPRDPDRKLGANFPPLVSSFFGCSVIRDIVLGEDEPHALTETDIVYPNSNRMYVRFLDHGNNPDIVESATLTWAGQTFDLIMAQTITVLGETADFLDSQLFEIDPADTLESHEAVATVCITGGTCYTRTYTTIA